MQAVDTMCNASLALFSLCETSSVSLVGNFPHSFEVGVVNILLYIASQVENQAVLRFL